MHRILVVDDDSGWRVIVGKHFTDLGYVVCFATNGWEALLSIDNQLPDLITLDLIMPGMDGPTFLRILRKDPRKKNVPVIIVTAQDTDYVKERIGDKAICGILSKLDKELLPRLTAVIAGIPPRE